MLKRSALALVLVAAATVLTSASASAGLFEQALKVALWSAIATDRRQTAQWIDYTPARPLTLTWERRTGPGVEPHVFRCDCIYESNPILAGQPEELDPYFDWWAAAVEAAPISKWSPAAKLGAALVAANWLRIVVDNNRSPHAIHARMTEAGMTYTGPKLRQYAAFEYRFRF